MSHEPEIIEAAIASQGQRSSISLKASHGTPSALKLTELKDCEV
jgi:hypothetical protein